MGKASEIAHVQNCYQKTAQVWANRYGNEAGGYSLYSKDNYEDHNYNGDEEGDKDDDDNNQYDDVDDDNDKDDDDENDDDNE